LKGYLGLKGRKPGNGETGGCFMSTLNKIANKRETLNIRIKPEEQSLIDHAARMRGKNRTNFILDAARLVV